MSERQLSDEQWCVLDLLMRARQKGVTLLNRRELMSSQLPDMAKVKLVWAALSMPEDLVSWVAQHDFAITEAGATVYNFRFGRGTNAANPTHVADAIICLPGPEHYAN